MFNSRVEISPDILSREEVHESSEYETIIAINKNVNFMVETFFVIAYKKYSGLKMFKYELNNILNYHNRLPDQRFLGGKIILYFASVIPFDISCNLRFIIILRKGCILSTNKIPSR